MINYSSRTLKNSTRLIFAPLKNTEAVTIMVLVGTGGRFETEREQGISHFLEHLFFKGSKKFPSAQKIAAALDALGANYNAFTSEECTGFFIQCAARDFPRALEILCDMFHEPLFPRPEVEREKDVILEEANMRRDIPQAHVQVLAQKQMFPDLPLGNDLVGTPETIKAISDKDIAAYFSRTYAPEATIVVVAGNPKNYSWENAVVPAFAAKAARRKPAFAPFRPGGLRESVVEEIRKVDQTHLVFSLLTFPKADPRRYALALLSYILGGGMSSRLFEKIRERRGWAYYVRTQPTPFFDTGVLSVLAGVKTTKLPDAVKIIREELADLATNGPTPEELERAKNNARGSLAISLEGSMEIAEALAEDYYYEGKFRQPEEVIEQINKVTLDNLRQIAKELFVRDKMGLAVIGGQNQKQILKKIMEE